MAAKAASSAIGVFTTWVLLAPAAGAQSIDTDSDEARFAGAALVVLLVVAALWFFVFRGGEHDTGADEATRLDESDDDGAPRDADGGEV